MIQWNKETLEKPESVAQILSLAETKWNERKTTYLEKGVYKKYINSIVTGYFAGKKPVYNVENIFNNEQDKDEELKFLIEYINIYNDDAKEFYDLAFEYFSMKACYEILYENCENEIVYAKQSALNTIGIFDYSTPVNQIGQLRKWKEKNKDNTDITVIELTTINGKRYYTPIQEDTKKLKELEDRKEKGKWHMLPCIAIENEIGLSSCELELMLSEEKNINNLGLINLYNHSVCDRDFFILEQIITSADKQFKKAILKRWETIIDRVNRRKNKQYDFRSIKIDLYRNVNL